MQIKYVILGAILGFGGGATNYPLWYSIPIPPVGNIFVSFGILVMAYAIIKHHLMDIRIALTRAGIFLFVYTFVLGIPFWIGYTTKTWFPATTLAVVLASLGPLIYRYLHLRAEEVLLAEQKRYQEVLLRASIGMVREHNLKKLSKLIVFILKKAIRLEFVAIYLFNEEENCLILEDVRGKESLTYPLAERINPNDTFFSYLMSHREPFLTDELPSSLKDCLPGLYETRVVIPSFSSSSILGCVLLGEKLSQQPFNEQDLNVFRILSRQAVLAIQNCRFMEESKHAQEKLFAAEKLASIGGMADGLAHQIKNRLNQFSLAAGELKAEIEDFGQKNASLIQQNPDLGKTFSYLKQISTSLLDNVKRTDGVIKGILDFSRVKNKEAFFTNFSLEEITELSLNLLKVKHQVTQIPLNLTYDNPTIYSIKSHLTEVIYNLLDNAYEAIKEKEAFLKQNHALNNFIPQLQLHLTHEPLRQIIKVSDNGIGIKEEDKLKIFAPFFTTKSSYKSGSGIGSYVVKRIVEENLKGKIYFESEYLKGTTFVIELPTKRQ